MQVSQLLSQLQELYSKQQDVDEQQRATLEPLRHPRMLQMLLEGGLKFRL